MRGPISIEKSNDVATEIAFHKKQIALHQKALNELQSTESGRTHFSDINKSCPFCGKAVEKIKSEYFRDNERLVLACPCGCRMVGREFNPYSCTKDEWENLETELLEAWNRRVDDD